MEPAVAHLLQWIEPHAILLALLLPAVIRVAGHWVPEELFMVAVGVLAARRSPGEAVVLLGAVWVGHFFTDQVVYAIGRGLRVPLLARERARKRVVPILERVRRSQKAVWSFVPARVLPLGRGAWLLALGAAAVPRLRFAIVDAVALVVHVVVWCGLGWMAEGQATVIMEVGKVGLLWAVAAAATSLGAVAVWRRLPASVRFVDRFSDS